MKDIVRRAGENIAAAEVEQVLRSHPGVLEAAIIAADDELRGEEIHAVVVLIDGQTPATAPAELVEYCASRLAKYKVPRYVTFHDGDFPRTPSMRVKKDEIRDTQPGWDRQQELGW
jgi:crotonobetaine/carnitine-CoA ligase